jgi:ssDNA-binding Zn-finger/Zn-ribbon topoisomerase 1
MEMHEGDSCPRCKVGKLLIKTGRYGSFLGCDMYHHTGCNFIQRLKIKNKTSLEEQADQLLAENGFKVLKIF